MNITILGYKFRVEFIILCILLIWFIHTNTFFSCAGGVKPGVKVIQEGFNLVEGLTKASVKAGKKATKNAAKNAAVAISKEIQQ
jgi:hypothetical protein